MQRDAHGDWWPDGDVAQSASCRDALIHVGTWLQHTVGRQSCIQAGGNCGLFPRELARHFAEVYTFEPDLENFKCLTRNCSAPNVYSYPRALGEQSGRAALHRRIENCGAHYIVAGDEFEVDTLDSYALPSCSLLALDVEGYEWPVLKGALATIGRFHPTIVWENKGRQAEKYGRGTVPLLKELGYRFVCVCGLDEVWKPPS